MKVVKDLEKKLADTEKILEEQRRIVECPVCLQMPREGPVPCCPRGHFICSKCLDEMKKEGKKCCPTCWAPMGQGKSLLAFTVIKHARHECSLQGCTEEIAFDDIKEHEEKCSRRLVICPGSDSCAKMIPFKLIEDHIESCRGCVRPSLSKSLKELRRGVFRSKKSLLSKEMVEAKGPLAW